MTFSLHFLFFLPSHLVYLCISCCCHIVPSSLLCLSTPGERGDQVAPLSRAGRMKNISYTVYHRSLCRLQVAQRQCRHSLEQLRASLNLVSKQPYYTCVAICILICENIQYSAFCWSIKNLPCLACMFTTADLLLCLVQSMPGSVPFIAMLFLDCALYKLDFAHRYLY